MTPGHPYLDHAPGEVLALAHRGGAKHPDLPGLENTLTAFEHAYAMGYDYLETDVHVTRDGVLLAFHDAVLDRVTDRAGRLADLTMAEVRAASIGDDHPIPTLEELLLALPRAKFNIDVKAAGTVRPLADLLDRHDAWGRILVGSFSSRRLREFRRLAAGRAPTSAGPFEVAVFRLCPSARLASLITGGHFEAFQIPLRRGRIEVATSELIRRAHARGKQVHVWTVDDPAEMKLLLGRGVDGLITDRTDILKAVLLERGQWKERT